MPSTSVAKPLFPITSASLPDKGSNAQSSVLPFTRVKAQWSCRSSRAKALPKRPARQQPQPKPSSFCRISLSSLQRSPSVSPYGRLSRPIYRIRYLEPCSVSLADPDPVEDICCLLLPHACTWHRSRGNFCLPSQCCLPSQSHASSTLQPI